MAEVRLDDGEDGHQRWKIAVGARVDRKWSALPIRIAFKIATDGLNGYSDGEIRRSSGQFRLKSTRSSVSPCRRLKYHGTIVN